MPKKLYKIVQFHGGLNNNSDPRDIAESELSEATDVMVDELGKIRMMGGIEAHKAGKNVVGGFTGTMVPGYGLFYFSHDRLGGEDAGSGEVETGDNYLALYDDNDQQVWIYSEVTDDDGGGTGWDDDSGSTGNGVIDIGATGSAKVVFYAADGALRVNDGNFGANNIGKWYGYIDKTWFPDIGSGYSIDQWYQIDQRPAPPSASYFKKDWIRTTGETATSDIIPAGDIVGSASAGAYAQETRTNIDNAFTAGDGTNAPIRCVVNISFLIMTTCYVTCTVKVGWWSDDSGGDGAGTGTWHASAQEEEIMTNQKISGSGTHIIETTFNYDPAVTDIDTYTPAGTGEENWRIEVTGLTKHSGNFAAYSIANSSIYEATATTFPELDDAASGGGLINGYSTGNNVCMLWA